MNEKYLVERVEMQANGTALVTTLYICEKTILSLLILEEQILFYEMRSFWVTLKITKNCGASIQTSLYISYTNYTITET